MLKPEVKSLLFVTVGNLVVGISGSMLASEFTGWTHRKDGVGFEFASKPVWLAMAVSTIAAIVFMIIGARQILRLRTRRMRKVINPKGRRALVILLSNLRFGKADSSRAATHFSSPPNEDNDDWCKTTLDLVTPKLKDGELAFLALDEDLAKLAAAKKEHGEPRWPWEQSLRAIQHGMNVGTLERLIIICSRESIVQVRAFVLLLKKYKLPLKVQVVLRQQHDTPLVLTYDQLSDSSPLKAEQGWDFDDFDSLFEVFDETLKILNRGHGKLSPLSDDEISIDWTSGTKPASVVAATITIDRPIVNQYVATEPVDPAAEIWAYSILGYDIVRN